MAAEFEDQLEELIRAGFTGIWVQTHDPLRTIKRIMTVKDRLQQQTGRNWSSSCWTASEGWVPAFGQLTNLPPISQLAPASRFSLMISKPFIGILFYPHRIINNNPEKLQVLHDYCQRIEQSYWICLVPPAVLPPNELEHVLRVVDEGLPSLDDYRYIVRNLFTSAELECSDQEIDRYAQCLKGLTMQEAENVLALTIIRSGRQLPDLESIRQFKVESIKQTGYLELVEPEHGFEQLGGLENLKRFSLAILQNGRPKKAKARGIFLTGVPGCGKSAFARALGAETKRPVIQLNINATLGSLVGQTEQNIRNALRIADSHEPCILYIDEVEKVLSGLQSSGKTDSGVTSRLFATVLTWLSDHQTDVFTIVTCNDIFKLPPEFYRSERFDAIFFVDFPSLEERKQIWQIYQQKYELPPIPEQMLQLQFTGAEIHSCCRLAALMDVSVEEAAKYVTPIINTIDRETLAAKCKMFIPASSSTEASAQEPLSRMERRMYARGHTQS